MYDQRTSFFGKRRNMIIVISAIVLIIAVSFFFVFRAGGLDLDIKMVSGTEYISGEYGQIIVRVADRNGNPFPDANCSASVLYPDKSYFLADYSMVQSSQPGNYYVEFMTPTINGIYEELITCTYTDKGQSQLLKISSSFHVSPALNFIVEMSILQAERYRDIVDRINNTRLELMEEINRTFNKDFAELLINKTDRLMLEIELAKNESAANVDGRFNSMYSDMAALGESMTQIFQNPG